MRICFFGDSFVNGTGDDDCLGWPGRLVAAARRGGCDITAYNLGIRRDASADIRARWQEEARRRLVEGVPMRLAFSFGTNDAVREGEATRVSLAASLDNSRAILAAAAGICATIMIGPAPILDDPAVDRHIGELSALQAVICGELGIPFLGIFDFVAGCEIWRREAAAGDGTHPNGGGYAALAGFIAADPKTERWLGA